MPIMLTRIDDRLIHGQVVEGWVKAIDVNHIIVISDEVANDKMQQALLSMAVPSSITVTVLSIDDAARVLQENKYAKDNLLLLLSRPADVVRLLYYGVAITSVNLGGMHYSQGKTQLLRNLSVNEADVDALFAISAKGVELEGRILPRDERIDVIEILREKFNR
ncbi:MAG: PTS sugar transporter subunit IIB [Elusimicrobia bacterium]|nr:PTS sugar transporter subunit IIB [Elusimicrobiota bacterium]